LAEVLKVLNERAPLCIAVIAKSCGRPKRGFGSKRRRTDRHKDQTGTACNLLMRKPGLLIAIIVLGTIGVGLIVNDRVHSRASLSRAESELLGKIN